MLSASNNFSFLFVQSFQEKYLTFFTFLEQYLEKTWTSIKSAIQIDTVLHMSCPININM